MSSKRKENCTPEEWTAHLARMREYEARPEVKARRKEYEQKRAVQRKQDPNYQEYMRNIRAQPKCRAKRMEYIKKYNADPAVKQYRKMYNLQKTYGISLDDLKRLLTHQKGVCSICRRPFDEAYRSTKPHVDHDHSTGAVRGLLCGPCNTFEGFLKLLGLEAAEFAVRMQAYLDHPPAGDVLDALWD